MFSSGFWLRVRAPVFLGSLTRQTGRCAPPPRPSQLRCSCLHHTFCLLRRALQFLSSCEAHWKSFPSNGQLMRQRKYSIVYFLYRVPEFLCCRMIWALLPPFLWEMAPPLSFYCLYCRFSSPTLTCRGGDGWSQTIQQHRNSGTLHTILTLRLRI